jgi:uncharacterized membrane protein
MVQAVSSTAHGRPLEVTHATGEQASRLASHVDPILALMSPLWIVAPSPLTLVAIQVAATALGALPVYWLARRRLGAESVAVALACAYLAYPWLAWTAVEAFHPVTLAIPLLLYAIWFLDTGRFWPAATCLALVLTTGELMGLTVAGLGLWLWLARGRRREGLALAVAGASWTALCLKVIVPAFSDGSSQFYERFASVGGSPEGLVRTVFTDPLAIVRALATVDDLAYVVWLALPLLGFFLLAPALSAVALPQLVVNMLSDSAPTTDPRTHYIAVLVPVLVAASVFGLGRLPERERLNAALLVLTVCIGLSLLVGQLLAVPGIKSIGYQATLSGSHARALREAVAHVPAGAAVSSTNRVGGHLSERRYVYSVSVIGRSEWIVADTSDPRLAKPDSSILEWDPAGFEAFLARIRGSGAWKRVYERDGVVVFRRVGAE